MGTTFKPVLSEVEGVASIFTQECQKPYIVANQNSPVSCMISSE